MKSYIYILQDKRGKFYIGSTSDLERRLKQHLGGHTQTTRNMCEPRLVLKQEVVTIRVARQIENRLKKLKRKDYIEKMILDGYVKIAE